jgi:hypothetical protein
VRVTPIAFSALLAAGCHQGDDEPYCNWEEDEISLDRSFGPFAGDLEYDLTPRKVLDQLLIPQRGELTWKHGGDWIDFTPSNETTGFSSEASYGGRTVWRRVPGADGSVALACRETFDYEVTITMKTDDGVLDEVWHTIVSFDLAAPLSSGSRSIDPEAEGLPEKLQLSPKPDPPRPFTNERYRMHVWWSMHILSPEEYPPSFHGRAFFRGDFQTETDGEVIEGGGINIKLMEWRGDAVTSEATSGGEADDPDRE